VFLYFFSTYIKYFREVVCNNFDDDKVLEKVFELQNKYTKGGSKISKKLEKVVNGK
jgi:hypothetical protein